MSEPGDSGRRIAIVDDNELTRLIASDLLRELGFEPCAYASCEEALRAFEAEPPAACIVDLVLPGMTGDALVRALRAHRDPRLRGLPVIATTSGSERPLLEAGASAALHKPLRGAALGALLRELLGAGRPDDRRAAVRVRARFPVTLQSGALRLEGTTADLSTTGFSIEAPSGLAAGDRVEFCIFGPRRAIRGAARAASVRSTGAAHDRVGLALEALGATDREELELVVFGRVPGRLPIR